MMYPKKVTKIKIGKAVDDCTELKAIEYASERPVGSGPGGEFISPKTVLNITKAVGVGHHHKQWEVVMGLREDEFKALYGTSVSDALKAIEMGGKNPAIGYFGILRRFADGDAKVWVYPNARVVGVPLAKSVNEEGKYIIEVKLLSPEREDGLIWDFADLVFSDGMEDIIDSSLFSTLVLYDEMEDIIDSGLFSTLVLYDGLEE